MYGEEGDRKLNLTEEYFDFDHGIMSIQCDDYDDSQKKMKQILDNQKIVDELLHFHGCPIVPSQEGSEGIKHYLNAIVKIATGKDIQEIHSMENVKN